MATSFTVVWVSQLWLLGLEWWCKGATTVPSPFSVTTTTLILQTTLSLQCHKHYLHINDCYTLHKQAVRLVLGCIKHFMNQVFAPTAIFAVQCEHECFSNNVSEVITCCKQNIIPSRSPSFGISLLLLLISIYFCSIFWKNGLLYQREESQECDVIINLKSSNNP